MNLCSQVEASFKSRGISHLIKTKLERIGSTDSLQVFSSSGGNAGLAAARASKALGVACTVVVPKTTNARMITKIESSGATVIVHGEHWKEADVYLRSELLSRVPSGNGLYVHPFDDPIIWEGHSVMIDEIVDQLAENSLKLENVKGIVCSVGGGGLFSGVIEGLERYGLESRIPVFAVETDGCDVLNRSLKTGKPVVLEKITSIATSLASTEISLNCYEKASYLKSRSLVLDDQDVLKTCLQFLDDTSILVEPACAASIHTVYHPEILGTMSPEDIVIVIVCGGSCYTYEEMKKLCIF